MTSATPFAHAELDPAAHKVVTVAEMRRIEAASVEAGVSLDRLTENAGLAIAGAVAHRLGGESGHRILALIGPGNNGGDGLVAARHLARNGASVIAVLCATRPDPDAKKRAAEGAGVSIDSVGLDGWESRLSNAAHQADAVLDAVLGTGTARPIRPPLSHALALVSEGMADSRAPVIAVDLPTGADADTGRFDPSGLPAHLTLMLGLPKAGPLLRPGDAHAGDITVLDIGIPPGLDEDLDLRLLTLATAAELLPPRSRAAHKGDFGQALIVAGSLRYVGAARLAAAAAVRSGAGLVTLAPPRSVYSLIAPALPEATYIPLSERKDGLLDAGAATREVRSAAEQASALLIGSGLGQQPLTAAFVRQLLGGPLSDLPLVLDADCLNILAGEPRWWQGVSAPAILTPHPGEMARLLGVSSRDVQIDRITIARDAAARWGHIVVLKGACTIVAHPDGRADISAWVNPGLAKGGTGDVLAGLIAGLLAQMPGRPFEAASLGVYAHGLAGHLARQIKGERGMAAGDLPDLLPDAFLQLEAVRPRQGPREP